MVAVMQGLKDTKDLGVGSLMLAGGLGGVAYWGPVYPADVIKSRIQVDDLRNPQYKGMMDCLSKVGGLPITYSCPQIHLLCILMHAEEIMHCTPMQIDITHAIHVQTLKSDGIGGLYKGFGPAIARSFPANGACFLVYELVSTAMKASAAEA